MITIKRNDELAMFQVELSLKVKTQQSPFIAILILAKELNEISAELLQQKLLSSLPVRACENLLKRLVSQGFLSENEHANYSTYRLTKFGEQCAIDETFWIGEKGVYKVYVSNSNLIKQKIVRTEKLERLENDKEGKITETPKEVSQYENQTLSINKTEVRFEDVESKCVKMRQVTCDIEVQAKENESKLKLLKDNKVLFQVDFDISESDFKEKLLSASKELEYHQEYRAVLIPFSKENLSFKRNLRINKPVFEGVTFSPVQLDNVMHIPIDKKNADLWYWELLFKKIDRYFIDDNSFNEFASEIAKPFQQYYNVKIPNRTELVSLFSKRDDAFYQKAKLETVDYLAY